MKQIWKYLQCALLVLPRIPLLATDTSIFTNENLKQQEREQQLRKKQESIPNITIDKPYVETASIPTSEISCFQINEIVIDDKTSGFDWVLGELKTSENLMLPRCIGSNGISAIMKKMQNIIISKGYVTTRVSAKQQDLTKGKLELIITAGIAKSIILTKDSDSRVFLKNALPIKKNDTVNLYDIEQGLENLKRLPSADVDIKFVPSNDKNTTAGDSDITVLWKQKFPVRLSASVDDSGSKSTGKYQGSLTLSVDNIGSLNDIFYVSINGDLGGGDTGSRGTKGNAFHYSIPFNYWLFSFNTSTSSYFQTVSGAMQSYVYSGDSISREVKVSKLIYRDGVRKTKLLLTGWLKSSRSYIDDILIDTQRRRTTGIDTAINHTENTQYGTMDVTITYKKGLDRLDALEAQESATDGGSSFPCVFKLDTSIAVPFGVFGKQFSYNGNYHLQKNQTPLIPNDYFSIGGRYSVRGFDGVNMLSSERGFTIGNEIVALSIAFGIDGYLGVDYGAVDGRSSESLVGKSLTGGVVGVRGKAGYLSYDLFAGMPLQKPTAFKTSPVTTGFSINLFF